MVSSFGRRPDPEPEADEELPPDVMQVELPPAGTIRVNVDLVLTPDSLAALERSLTTTVARAVMAGFAQAAMETRN